MTVNDGRSAPKPGSRANHAAAQPRMRADARRNRVLVLAAAREVVAERGVTVPLEEIAARAGVGIGTLYRRFPTRKELIAPIVEELIEEYRLLIEQVVADPDPWRGFCSYFQQAVAMQVANRGLAEALTHSPTPLLAEQATRVRQLTRRGLASVMRRAKAEGSLRPDFSLTDLQAIFWACAQVADASADANPDFWRRHLNIVLDGLRAENRTRMPRAALTREQLDALQAANRESGPTLE